MCRKVRFACRIRPRAVRPGGSWANRAQPVTAVGDTRYGGPAAHAHPCRCGSRPKIGRWIDVFLTRRRCVRGFGGAGRFLGERRSWKPGFLSVAFRRSCWVCHTLVLSDVPFGRRSPLELAVLREPPPSCGVGRRLRKFFGLRTVTWGCYLSAIPRLAAGGPCPFVFRVSGPRPLGSPPGANSVFVHLVAIGPRPWQWLRPGYRRLPERTASAGAPLRRPRAARRGDAPLGMLACGPCVPREPFRRSLCRIAVRPTPPPAAAAAPWPAR